MDINNDGVLQCEEFVQMIRFLMRLGAVLMSVELAARAKKNQTARLDFYPHHILKHLNLWIRHFFERVGPSNLGHWVPKNGAST